MSALALMAVLIAAGCSDPAGITPGPNPEGDPVAWFNGLGYTVDLYFPKVDSLVAGAYHTGEVPCDIRTTSPRTFAVLSTLSCQLRLYDTGQEGTPTKAIELPAGSNPYSMCWDGEVFWVALLLSGEVARVTPEGGVTTYDTPANPTSVASTCDLVIVGHGNWPDSSVTGGLTLLDAGSGEILDSVQTPDNVTALEYFPQTGMVHVSTSTFTGDGMINVVDPGSGSVEATVATGGSPGRPVAVEGGFAAGDGWTSGRVYLYGEDGSLDVWESGMSSVTGLALMEGMLYLTDFNGDRVLVAEASTLTPVDTLASGDGPQGIAAVE